MADARFSPEAGHGPNAVRVWDIGVRIFHWSLAILFVLNFWVLSPRWALHWWTGWAIAVLVALRLVWGLVGTRYARFSAFPPSLSAAREHAIALLRGHGEEPALSHNPLGALMVYNLLACMVLMAATGTVAHFKLLGDWVGDVHEVIANFAAICIGLHVLGVAVESWRSRVPLVRAMLTGWKELPRRP